MTCDLVARRHDTVVKKSLMNSRGLHQQSIMGLPGGQSGLWWAT
ncbi:hypothetical protein I552_1557 [Mycobacterium xenopi 3993]|nr:hypothetical protein I552_1557 [Mycobacterium xenopi 3993]